MDDLPANLRAADPAPRHAAPTQQVTTLQEAVERAEIEAIKVALARTEGRRSEAAQLLGVSRKTLWEKTKHYELETE